MILDVHSHIITPGYLDEVRKPGGLYRERLEPGSSGNEELVFAGGGRFELIPQLRDPEALLLDLKAIGVDAAVVSPPPMLFHYELERQPARAHARLVNDETAALARASEGRLIGMATVPLQHPDLAVEELTRAVENLGLRSVEICTNVAGLNLDEPEFFQFFQRAAELGVLVFVHPWFVVGGERLTRYHLINAIGNPFDTTIAAASLIFGGVFERLPSLKVLFAHAGGAAPYIVGRLNRAHHIRPEAGNAIPKPPSHYLGRAYFDTIGYTPAVIQFLINAYGVDHVLLGTDYPFHVYDMGDPNAVQTVNGLIGVDDAAKKHILGANAARLLGLA